MAYARPMTLCPACGAAAPVGARFCPACGTPVAGAQPEERRIGEQVSLKIRQRFGVVQDPAVHRYVSLVGTTLARASARPNLAWTFIVLDTDGVNAFASPEIGRAHV